MATVVLTDSQVLARLRPTDAVECMLGALSAHAAGRLISPPRASAPLGDAKVVVTAGADDHTFGYRVYDTAGLPQGEQVVVAHDASSGRVVAVAVGNALGALRTGALGGAAASLLGPSAATVTVDLVGAGAQAWTQIWALTAVSPISEVRVFARTPSSREAMARRIRDQLGIPSRAVDDARKAVKSADLVVLATTSSTPVIETAWLQPDVLVITLGPKQVGRAEFGLDLLDGASVVTTDSLEQLRSYSPAALVVAAGVVDGVVDLGRLAAGLAPCVRTGRRVHLSVGLAGTEPLLLRAIAERSE